MKTKMFSVVALIAGLAISYSFMVSDAGDPWVVPDKYKNMKNPVKADKASLTAGAALWTKHCASCHGKKGLGDGSKAAQLDTQPGDFTDKKVQAQTDGSIFYKSWEGRDDMPSFKKKIPDQEDIWNLVNYIRSLGK